MTAAPGLVLDRPGTAIPVAPTRGVRGRLTISRAHNVAARRVLTPILLGASGFMVVRLLAQAGAVAPALGSFRWVWLPAIGLAAASTYAMAALALTAASGQLLHFRRTLAAQLAASFTNRMAPAGIGAMATNVRYLQQAGLARARAVTAIALNSLAGLVAHVIAIGAVLVLAGTVHGPFGFRAPEVPDVWPWLVVAAVVVGVAALTVRRRYLGGRLAASFVAARSHAAALVRQPLRAFGLLGAAIGVTTAFALALVASVQAAGGGPSFVSIVAVYLGGSAIAAAVPTPGGLGALEAGLVAGLTAVGQPPAPAMTAVLVFRIVTYWLPVVPGAVALWALRRSGRL